MKPTLFSLTAVSRQGRLRAPLQYFAKKVFGDEKPRYLTPQGRIVLFATLLSGLAIVTDDLVPVAVLLLCGWTVQLCIGAILRPKIQCEFLWDLDAVVGQTGKLQFLIRNLSRFPARNVTVTVDLPNSDHPPEIFIKYLPGRERSLSTEKTAVSKDNSGSRIVRVIYPVITRGYWNLLTWNAQSSFPFGWWNYRSSGNSRANLWSHPSASECTAFVVNNLLRQSAFGVQAAMDAAANGLVSGCREYTPGMYVRRWNYAAWARTNMPVACEFSADNTTTLALLMHPVRTSGADNEIDPAFEQQLSATLGLCQQLTHNCSQLSLIVAVWTHHHWDLVTCDCLDVTSIAAGMNRIARSLAQATAIKHSEDASFWEKQIEDLYSELKRRTTSILPIISDELATDHPSLLTIASTFAITELIEVSEEGVTIQRFAPLLETCR